MKRDMNALEHDNGLQSYISRSTYVPTPKQRMDNWDNIYPIFANRDLKMKQHLELMK